jgi:hypothetical protein
LLKRLSPVWEKARLFHRNNFFISFLSLCFDDVLWVRRIRKIIILHAFSTIKLEGGWR